MPTILCRFVLIIAWHEYCRLLGIKTLNDSLHKVDFFIELVVTFFPLTTKNNMFFAPERSFLCHVRGYPPGQDIDV
jgi:hypothetical protein